MRAGCGGHRCRPGIHRAEERRECRTPLDLNRSGCAQLEAPALKGAAKLSDVLEATYGGHGAQDLHALRAAAAGIIALASTNAAGRVCALRATRGLLQVLLHGAGGGTYRVAPFVRGAAAAGSLRLQLMLR